MLPNFLAIAFVGAVGGILQQLLLEKRLYMPKMKEDDLGRYFDPGFLVDVFLGVIAAFVAAWPLMEHLPILPLMYAVLMPAVCGKSFLSSLTKQYVERNRDTLVEEIESNPAPDNETE